MFRRIERLLRDRGFADIAPIYCGVEQWRAGDDYGPTIRDHYLLHYVVSGKGTFWKDDEVYSMSAGQYFLLRPGEEGRYAASASDPFKCVWITFAGAQTRRYDELPSVGQTEGAPFLELEDMIRSDFAGWDNLREEYVVTTLHRFAATMCNALPVNQHYASRVAHFIRTSYMLDISVQNIADSLALTRRHLSRLFKERYGMTIQEYLLSVRLDAAARLLREGHSVAESAELCGYSDRSNFSRMFCKRYGVWPSDYAKQKEE